MTQCKWPIVVDCSTRAECVLPSGHGGEHNSGMAQDNEEWKHAEWARRTREIGQHCCCARERAVDCQYERYSIPPEDFDDGCTCICHVQLIDLEKELWPNDAE